MTGLMSPSTHMVVSRASPVSQYVSTSPPVVTLTFECQCPYRTANVNPGAPRLKSCAGNVLIGVSEVPGTKPFSGIKGVKVTVKLWHAV